MNVAHSDPNGLLRTVTATNRAELSRRAKSGAAIRIAPGIYVEGAKLRPEQVARHHLFKIIELTWPNSVLCGRTALAGGAPDDGFIYVAMPEPGRRAPLRLPGITVVPVAAPPPLQGDMPMPGGLFLSGPARRLVENVTTRGRPAQYRAGNRAVEDRIDAMAREGGTGRIRETIEQLDVIATSFEPASVEFVRTRLRAVLGSSSDGGVVATSARLAARIAGEPFDQHRLDLMERLIHVLDDHAPRPVPLLGDESRWEWEPFFEAYFSNFIEGTEFGVDEARRIAIDKEVPAARPEDAHDVAATFHLSADTSDRIRVPSTEDELVEILSHRHSILMAARPEKHPGKFKAQRNFAGGYHFVEPELVEGTLRRGFNMMRSVRDPHGRAIAMMALITECHPFDDGNGRVARLTANAELSAAGQVRIVIPTVFRNNYLAALTGFSRGAGRGESLISVLEYAQRWTAAVDWRSFDRANTVLEGTNAFMDSGVADASGVRLEMPPKLSG